MRAPSAWPPAARAERWALEQDQTDPVAWGRDAFEHPVGPDGQPLVYLCGNSLGLMPRSARELVNRELEHWARRAVEGHLEGDRPWYDYHAGLAAPLARLVGALPEEVVAMNSLTVNLHLMMVSFYRPAGARWKVLLEEAAFPSDSYAVASHLAARGMDPESGVLLARPRPGEETLRIEDLEALLAERGEEIALVLLPGVQYFTGQLLDIERITKAAHAAGALAGFDLAHAAGNAVLSLHDWNVDFAAWCSYKYLNAGPGAVAGCFVHQRHGRNLSLPRLAGWWGNDPATRFQMHLNRKFVPVPGADGWQLSNPPILALAPLVASLALFDQAGMPALRAKSERLTGYLEFLLSGPGAGRLEILTPPEPADRGCQLSLRIARGAESLTTALRQQGIVGDFRAPDVLRLSPAPLYNSFRDVWRAATAVSALLDAAP